MISTKIKETIKAQVMEIAEDKEFIVEMTTTLLNTGITGLAEVVGNIRLVS